MKGNYFLIYFSHATENYIKNMPWTVYLGFLKTSNFRRIQKTTLGRYSKCATIFQAGIISLRFLFLDKFQTSFPNTRYLHLFWNSHVSLPEETNPAWSEISLPKGWKSCSFSRITSTGNWVIEEQMLFHCWIIYELEQQKLSERAKGKPKRL